MSSKSTSVNDSVELDPIEEASTESYSLDVS